MMSNSGRGIVCVVAILMCLICESSGYDHFVGGRSGWRLKPSEKLNDWAERSRFQVNDRLVFRYNKGEDSVLHVDLQDYDTCNTTNPIGRMDDGNSAFTLDRSGYFFFISGHGDRCNQGEKLVVLVMAVRNRPGRAPAPALPPSASAPPAPSALVPSPSGPIFVGVPGPAPSPAEDGGAAAAARSGARRLGVGCRVYLGVLVGGVVFGGAWFV